MLSAVRIAVVGVGYWGPKIVRNLNSLPQTSVTLLADLDPNQLKLAARATPGVRTTTCLDEVWAADVDGIVIATPVRTHYALAKAALLAGKHVLVEKPLTTDVAEAEELVALAQSRRLTLMVGHTFVYNPAIYQLRELALGGELGHIYEINLERLNLGLFRSDIDVIWDLAPHDVSILLYLLEQEPERVEVLARTHVRPQVYDTAHLDFQFPSGASAHAHVSWHYPTKTRRVTVIGDKRMVVCDDTNQTTTLTIYDCGADVSADPHISYRRGETYVASFEWDEPLRLECDDFTSAIRFETTPRASGAEGLRVVRILAHAQEALALRRLERIAVRG